ncbi:MAG: recombination protein RecR [Acidobacteria bacterium RIFCSPLOWO2_02_FULL_60_20]|nr:MAG: recombination protein RecR [Acidobacteria bacterium RIFCSPLOWO2_02_FULL_60_20]
MPEYAKPMSRLIDELKRLPGVGPKSAQRIAFHLLKLEDADSERLAAAIRELKQSIRLCEVCHNITESSPCGYCADASRDSRLLCVVEEPAGIVPIEKTGHYRGRYHVLHGVLSPLHGVGPEQLRIESLLERVRAGGIEEVIVATNPTVEGEATAVYLSKLLKPLGVSVTRIAMGVPVGSELEYVDAATMARAMDGRKAI